MDFLIGSTNKGKIQEIQEALSGLQLSFVSLRDKGITDTPSEEGKTFQENALLKARFYHTRSSLPVIADDSGIEVEALRNELGLHTRRWGAGPAATDEEWITHFLSRMEKESNRRARFLCAIAYIDVRGNEHLFEGACDGQITRTVEAAYLPGLPLSACFRPDDCEHVFSALTIEQKNSTSHRGKALSALEEYLKNISNN